MFIDELLRPTPTFARPVGRLRTCCRARCATARAPVAPPCGTSRPTSQISRRTRLCSFAGQPDTQVPVADLQSALALAARPIGAARAVVRDSRARRARRRGPPRCDRGRAAAPPPMLPGSGFDRRLPYGDRRFVRQTAARARCSRVAHSKTCRLGAHEQGARASPGYSNPRDPASAAYNDAPARGHRASPAPPSRRRVRDRSRPASAKLGRPGRHPIVRDRMHMTRIDVARCVYLTPRQFSTISRRATSPPDPQTVR